MNGENQENVLKGLQNLLEEQIKLTRRGNCDSVRLDQLNRQADVLVRKIAQTKLLQQDRFKSHKDKLQKAYNDLYLAVMAEQKQIAENLSKIRKGKKAVGIYQKNL
jgi:SMC interacting uncharacterized protein involved in chromosome segregation